MPKGLILWDIPRPYPNSMDRYADRLGHHLRINFGTSSWTFVDLMPWSGKRSDYATDSGLARWMDLAARFVAYPIAAFFSVADIYHIVDHGYGHLAYPLIRRNLVITCNDLMTMRIAAGDIPGTSVSPLSLAKFRWIVAGLQLAVAVIAISQSTKMDLIRFMGIPDEKIHVVYMGVDEQFCRITEHLRVTHLRDSLNIPADSRVVMHVSGVTAYKNIEGVLRTLAVLIHDLRMPTYLLRVGGPLTAEHRRLACDLGVDTFLREAGHLTDAELVTAYNIADVLLFPSWWEGFGLPPLEAMACGTPVVVSNRGSLPEVVGDAGVVVAPDDYREMALAIQRIIENDAWRDSLIAHGFARAARFSWENTAKATLRVYESVLASAPRLANQ